eukprot:3531632-Pleurochrysis_carterae.AAC.1
MSLAEHHLFTPSRRICQRSMARVWIRRFVGRWLGGWVVGWFALRPNACRATRAWAAGRQEYALERRPYERICSSSLGFGLETLDRKHTARATVLGTSRPTSIPAASIRTLEHGLGRTARAQESANSHTGEETFLDDNSYEDLDMRVERLMRGYRT